MIGELLVDLFCECFVVFCRSLFWFEKVQYTNATGLVYFHTGSSPCDCIGESF